MNIVLHQRDENDTFDGVKEMLNVIRKDIHLIHGNMYEEEMEQLMIVKYLEKDDKVLEFGSNMGRTSHVISCIVDKENFVTLEPNTTYFNCLCENMKNNNKDFNVENCAISDNPVFYHETRTFEPIFRTEKGIEYCEKNVENMELVNNVTGNISLTRAKTITFQELEQKYNITFDTFVIDCEGAFYTILKNTPDILDNVKKIIVENDYVQRYSKEYVLDIFKKKGFSCVFSADLDGYEPYMCSMNGFYQVWLKLFTPDHN